MSSTNQEFDVQTLLDQVGQAVADGKLIQSAAENIETWLTESRYELYAGEVANHIRDGKWQVLDDVFWTIIPFGTGGRRGRMYPIGSNAINDRTIGESAQGLANYVKQQLPDDKALACAIAYDTRHRSRDFAELCAGIMVAAGFHVYFLEDYRSTPELSFLVRYKRCDCGIMVTASHNPPSDNAVKVYWSTGGQVLPPHDRAIIENVMSVDEIELTPFADALAAGKVTLCADEIDPAYQAQLANQRLAGPRDLKVLYTPLHGVGAYSVKEALEEDGFELEVFEPHSKPDGDFPNVPEHVSNPENPAVFDAAIAHAQQTGAELILATDPDCDRMGCAAPLTTDPAGKWKTLNGNQLGSLLTDFILESRAKAGGLSSEHYVVKTLVTTEMIRRIANHYGVKTFGNLLVGFKWIAGVMDEQGADRFVFGTEESHGFLVGQYVRDKDGAVACMLMAELVAKLKAEGQSLHQKLESLYWQFGYHAEHLLNVRMEGSEGMQLMQQLMQKFRTQPPKQLAGLEVAAVRDYQTQQRLLSNGSIEPLAGPHDNLVILDLAEEGNYIAVRPSGTEPKVKFYMFTYTPAEQLANLETTAEEMQERLSLMERDLRSFAK